MVELITEYILTAVQTSRPTKKCAEFFHVGALVVINKSYNGFEKVVFLNKGVAENKNVSKKAQKAVMLQEQKFHFIENACFFCQLSSLEVDTENSERGSRFFFLARTQPPPFYTNILMGDALECLKY